MTKDEFEAWMANTKARSTAQPTIICCVCRHNSIITVWSKVVLRMPSGPLVYAFCPRCNAGAPDTPAQGVKMLEFVERFKMQMMNAIIVGTTGMPKCCNCLGEYPNAQWRKIILYRRTMPRSRSINVYCCAICPECNKACGPCVYSLPKERVLKNIDCALAEPLAIKLERWSKRRFEYYRTKKTDWLGIVKSELVVTCAFAALCLSYGISTRLMRAPS